MKKEFIRKGVKFTLEVVDWKEFNEMVEEYRMYDREYVDWSSAIYVRKQLEDRYNYCKNEYTNPETEDALECLLALEYHCKQCLNEWDENGTENDWKNYFIQQAELAEEDAILKHEVD